MIIGIIFLLALVLRVYNLGSFPVGFHADEVRAGWNAYSITKTGMDDRGNRFALYYNTFGDYRPTGIFYATIPSVLVFRNSEFAVRLPSALFGALSVVALYFLVLELLRKTTQNVTRNNAKSYTAYSIRYTPYIAALLLAISPWHINTSRSTSEAVISLFLVLTGIYFLLKFLNSKEKRLMLFSGILLSLSYFFYHSARLLVPVFILVIVVYFWKNVSGEIKKTLIGLLIFLTFLTFLLSLNPASRGRFSQVSIFNDLDVQYELSKMPFEEGPNQVFTARLFHNKILVYGRRFIKEYSRYFSPDFLISETARPARYATVGMGVLTYVEAGLLVVGFIALAQRKFMLLPALLLFAAPFPAALTTEDAPNLHRALFMVPFVAIVGAYGFFWLLNIKRWGILFSRGVALALLLNIIFYLHMYYVHDKVHAPLYRNVGAKELVLKINEIQNDYDKIIITNIPDDPYPWLAFFTKRDPGTFNKDAVTREKGVWTSGNLVFTGLRCPSQDALVKPDVARLLVIDAEGCAKESKWKGRDGIGMTQIFRPDNTEAYTLWSIK